MANNIQLSIAQLSDILTTGFSELKSDQYMRRLNSGQERLDLFVTLSKLGGPPPIKKSKELGKLLLNNEGNQLTNDKNLNLSKRETNFLHDILNVLDKMDQHSYLSTMLALENPPQYTSDMTIWDFMKIRTGIDNSHSENDIKKVFFETMPGSLEEFKKGIVETCVAKGVSLDMAKIENVRTVNESVIEFVKDIGRSAVDLIKPLGKAFINAHRL